MGFKLRAPFGDTHKIRVAHEKYRMRVAHIDGNRVGQPTHFQPQMQRVARFRKRDLAPVPFWCAHIHPHLLAFGAFSGADACCRLNGDGLFLFFAQENIAHTARGIAAGGNLRAIRIVNLHSHIRRFGRGENHQLVAANTKSPVTKALHLLGRKRHSHFPPVKHDEVVAGTMHFAEGKVHGR